MWIYFILIIHLLIFLWQFTHKPRPANPPPPATAESTHSDLHNNQPAAPVVHKYDVFLSFRGTDTRLNFTSHLYAALRGRTILSYIDDVNLRRGADITDSLLKAIEHSKMAVVVFSDNYASSGWCLDELVKILHCRNHFNQVVLPVFYGVSPSNVQNLTGNCAAAFAKLRSSPSSSPDKLRIWKAALKEAADLPGCNSLHIRTEAELVKTVVENVLTTLNQIYPTPQFTGLVGIHTRMDDIESLLQLELASKTRIIGMWGMGGVGKTTLARATYDEFSSKFEACHFLGNIREELGRRSELGLQHELFSNILEDDDHPTQKSTNLALTFMKTRLARTKVLIVLDDIDDPVALHNLLDKQPLTLFGPGSRILVTSRDHQVLQNVCDEIYELKGLNDYESLQLFTSNAFKEDPSEDSVELSWRAIHYPSGNPLALIVLAKALYGRSKEYWESVLLRLQREPNRKVQNVLRISYDGLDREEKNAFLDVACFYKGETRAHLKSMLDGSYGDGSSENIITSLTDRALVGIGHDESTVMMHDLLQEMGRDIVNGESDDPGERSRLWDPNDVYDVLSRKGGTRRIKGISMELSGAGEMYLDSDAFAKMTRLRVLRFNLPYGNDNHAAMLLPEEGLQYLSNQLMSIHWPRFNSSSLPQTFCAENLIDLRLPYSTVKHLWTGVQNLGSLKYIDLSYCKSLVELPDLSHAKRIEDMYLLGCESLEGIPIYIQQLETLANFNVWNCKRLPDLPTQFTSKFINSLSLSAENCPALANYEQIYFGHDGQHHQIEEEPEHAVIPTKVLDVRNSLNITDLRLNGTEIQELPASIEQLTEVTLLDMSNSKHFRSVSANICKLKKLKTLDFSGCVGLESFPVILEPMEQLSHLFLGGTSIRELSSISIQNLVNLTCLRLNNCRRLLSLPEAIEFCHQLTEIDIRDCESVVCLPPLPWCLKTLNADDCLALNSFQDCTHLRNLVALRLGNCFLLDQDAITQWMQEACADVQRIAAEMYFPGSEIPDCFEFKSEGCEITIALPSNIEDLEYGSKGIAYCLVVEDDGGPTSCSVANADPDSRVGKYAAIIPTLECHWKVLSSSSSCSSKEVSGGYGRCSDGTWYHNAFTRGFTQFKSDHLFITYRSRDHDSQLFDARNLGSDVSFRFQFSDCWKVKKVGMMIVQFDYEDVCFDDDHVSFDEMDWTAASQSHGDDDDQLLLY
ncbi:Disease resistance-like protein DSC1 [Linum perenne]